MFEDYNALHRELRKEILVDDAPLGDIIMNTNED